MSDYATNQVSSPAAAVGARSSASVSTWQPCTTVYSALAAKQAIADNG